VVAITQIRYRHTKGRACYDKKLAEGKTPKEALRALKRQISDAIFACLQEDARARRRGEEPGRATGEPLCIQGGRLTPRPPALRASHSRACHPPCDPRRFLSRAAAIPCKRAAGSKTGRNPPAQRRPQSVLDAATREPVMPRSGKEDRRPDAQPSQLEAAPASHQRFPLTLKQRGVPTIGRIGYASGSVSG